MLDDPVASALRAAARFGPYFTWEPWEGDPSWHPLRDLLTPEVVAARVALGRQTLAGLGGLRPDDLEERAVASIIFLGLASRLVSPLVGAAAAGGALPAPDIDRMWWRQVPGGPIPIAWRDLRTAPESDAAQLLVLVEPILDVFRERYALSPRVLWGNVASALGGAAGMIADAAPRIAGAVPGAGTAAGAAVPGAVPGAGTAAGAAVPGAGLSAEAASGVAGVPGVLAGTGVGVGTAAGRAAAFVEEALRLPQLRGSGSLVRPDADRERWFLVRANCCLYYRIPGGGTCGDCVLTPEPARRRQWQAVLNR
ncbi:(2Fe-2S)-binding protein [Actinoplanes sp. DH11]|uniref:(2Fe-2S)-binding protein n=1 Tax=Actinoplanes sp. DH11 TaxID=2857011 RepID=UPI001E381892|nr:(2Fe-2S)-binding protein [Actinoplanes sp. DH11]